MRIKLVAVLMLTILICTLTLTFNVHRARSEPTTIIVPDDYPTIQEAINAATAGDTVYVRSGTYSENVVVDKTLSLIGEDKATTVILGAASAQERRSAITIEADNVTMSGLKILNSVYNGIWVKTSGNMIRDNVIEGGDWEGIFLDGRTSQADRNTVINNYIGGKGDCGILVRGGSSFNLIKSNVITRNYFGIYMIDPPTGNNTIADNQITDNSDIGISLDWSSSHNIIIGNNVSDNGWRGSIIKAGFYIAIESISNQIIGNSIMRNKIGIYLNYLSNDNSIFHNTLVSNSKHIYNEMATHAPSVDIWDNDYPSGGNFWSNYTGVDLFKGPYQNVTGSDGIGDTRYVIDNYNSDRYPLMNPDDPSSLIGDLNYDLKVDIRDLALAASAFGSYPGHPKWNFMVDVNQDGKIDIRDLVLIVKNFGKKM